MRENDFFYIYYLSVCVWVPFLLLFVVLTSNNVSTKFQIKILLLFPFTCRKWKLKKQEKTTEKMLFLWVAPLNLIHFGVTSKIQHNGRVWEWRRVIYSFEQATAMREDREWSTLKRKCRIRSIVFAFALRKLRRMNGSIVWRLYAAGHLISPWAESQEPCGRCGAWLEAISPGALLYWLGGVHLPP